MRNLPSSIYNTLSSARAHAKPGEWIMLREAWNPRTKHYAVVSQEERMRLSMQWISKERVK
jgi:hypothetical protein